MITNKTLPVQANGHILRGPAETEVMCWQGELFPHTMLTCAVCGLRTAGQIVDGDVHMPTPCALQDGITTTITLDVPSGKILVSDSLRPVYDWDDRGLAPYESALGQAQAMKAMAAIGCAFGPVLHGADLYRTGPDSYVIANPMLDEYGEPVMPDTTHLARVHSGLWAYSIADFEHWKSRGGDPATLDWTDTVVDVTPGVYQFTNHQGERGFEADSAETVIFAHVERIA
ncbi:hypothetical protein C9F11_42865 (plasmid) [Streptomyces sp. YIM 121038]|uniref:hypothetical protein n=1 Tax=Streptomyces sp. YIM 121038 TaxID=2136401 RepID=UPI0011102FAD|nr:hypothetical protein [Streptomyces sp. YIM 121038]QCX82153.1 hypothetical protein C9F11_42865 [Streptomyces sp. YIM 121038]